ncbi:MAG: 50S ribosomal protein L1 [Candidatus Omnitrophica bacterium]|nr:50S ribosomal protein L1 [Candidatus Omnitrophota bacterium]
MATKISKRITEAYKKVEEGKAYPLKDAVTVVGQMPKTKFNETVELHFHLGIDTKDSDQNVRGTIVLPNGTGKTVRVAVICQGDNIAKAKNAGADYVGGMDLIEKIDKEGFLDFDCIVATPDMMKDLSKLGKVLGPRGLMPSPKAGTVTPDVERALREVKAGRVEFKSDKQGGVHLGIGKRSFTDEQIISNAQVVIDSISHAKPASVKGVFIKSVYLSSTMGAGVKVAI